MIKKQLKILYRRHMFIMILMEKKLLEPFMKKNCEKKSKEFRFENIISRKGAKHM